MFRHLALLDVSVWEFLEVPKSHVLANLDVLCFQHVFSVLEYVTERQRIGPQREPRDGPVHIGIQTGPSQQVGITPSSDQWNFQ